MPSKTLTAIPVLLPPPFLLPRFLVHPRNGSLQKRYFGIKSIDPPRPNRFNIGPGLSPLLSSSTAALERKAKANTLPLRTGALAKKKGMTAIFDTETGVRTPCTVLQLDRVQVVSHKTRKRHGYYAVCVGYGTRHEKNISKAMLGHYSVQGVSPKRELQEFRVADHHGLLAVGEEIQADWFMEGQFVDTRSHCKGKGFQGVMKRWGMHGQDRSHGVSLTHRSMGSAGPGQGGGSRVYPGKKMAGNMGGQRNTIQSLKVLQVDAAKGIVVVNGKTAIIILSCLSNCWLTFAVRSCEWTQKLSGDDSRCVEEAMAECTTSTEASRVERREERSSGCQEMIITVRIAKYSDSFAPQVLQSITKTLKTCSIKADFEEYHDTELVSHTAMCLHFRTTIILLFQGMVSSFSTRRAQTRCTAFTFLS